MKKKTRTTRVYNPEFGEYEWKEVETGKLLKSSIKSIADQGKNWTSASRIKNFIYLCNRELRFGLESILSVFEKLFLVNSGILCNFAN